MTRTGGLPSLSVSRQNTERRRERDLCISCLYRKERDKERETETERETSREGEIEREIERVGERV
jgi:hypothetical protein